MNAKTLKVVKRNIERVHRRAKCHFCPRVLKNLGSRALHEKFAHPQQWQPGKWHQRRLAQLPHAHPYRAFFKSLKQLAKIAPALAAGADQLRAEMDKLRDDNRALRMNMDAVSAMVLRRAGRLTDRPVNGDKP